MNVGCKVRYVLMVLRYRMRFIKLYLTDKCLVLEQTGSYMGKIPKFKLV